MRVPEHRGLEHVGSLLVGPLVCHPKMQPVDLGAELLVLGGEAPEHVLIDTSGRHACEQILAHRLAGLHLHRGADQGVLRHRRGEALHGRDEWCLTREHRESAREAVGDALLGVLAVLRVIAQD